MRGSILACACRPITIFYGCKFLFVCESGHIQTLLLLFLLLSTEVEQARRKQREQTNHSELEAAYVRNFEKEQARLAEQATQAAQAAAEALTKEEKKAKAAKKRATTRFRKDAISRRIGTCVQAQIR